MSHHGRHPPGRVSYCLPALLVALALPMAGCPEGPQATAPSPCDPLRGSDCPADEVCAVTGDGARCRPPQPAPADRPCAAASCPAGQACTAVEGLLACRPLCRPDAPAAAPCPEGPTCGYRLAALDLGVCPARCEIGGPCGPGATCGLSPALSHPICVAIGPVAEGEDCSSARCAAGLACLESADPPIPRCIRLCEPEGAPCPSGACTGRVSGVQQVGYCAHDS